jgi:beta-glucanase (GH16 family)
MKTFSTFNFQLSIALALLLLLPFAACQKDDIPPDEPVTPVDTTDNPIGFLDGYTILWEDQFDGDALNLDDWNIEVNGDGGGNAELQYYRAENVSIGPDPSGARSCLILTARKESFGGKTATSGRVNTQGKRFFTFVRIDALIRLPKTANGLWPAFWTMGNDYRSVGWPRCGELDILEMGHSNGYNGRQDKLLNGACHWGPEWPNASYAKDYISPIGLQDDFHLFTLIWNNEKVATYIDLDQNPEAKPYFEMDISSREDPRSPGNYFQKDFFILFNLAVGGNFPGIWDINGITALANGDAHMYIDYIIVSKKDEG